MSEKDRQSQRRTILRNSPIAGGIGPTQTHLYMDGTKLMGQQYDGVAKTIIDFSAIPATTPVGSMTQYGGDTAPSGWLMCDGNSLPKASYADLFSVIAYKYGGSGDNFNLPDLRGRIPVHRKSTDTAFDTLGDTGGQQNLTLDEDNMPAHDHTASMSSVYWGANKLHAHQSIYPYIIDSTDAGATEGAYSSGRTSDPDNDSWWAMQYVGSGSGPHTTSSDNTGFSRYTMVVGDPDKGNTLAVSGTVTIGETGGGGEGTVTDNMPPYIVTNTIIRYA